MKQYNIAYFCLIMAFSQASCADSKQNRPTNNMNTENSLSEKLDTATFGAGCFWCVEAIFQRLEGVEKLSSGYSGGDIKNPSYKEVCTGRTNHAEAVQILFDPSKISYDELLEVFWKTHDPTTLNKQGADEGTQYRSVIFYHNDNQREIAENYKKKLNASGAWDKPVITEISAFKNFYIAEENHQNYFNENGNQPYCSYVIQPKIEKFEKVFKGKLKKQAAH